MTRQPYQTLPNDEPDDGGGLDLPPELLADLRSVGGGPPAVPPAVDAAVRRQAVAYFARQRRVRTSARWAGAVAAAAVVLVGVRLAVFPGGSAGSGDRAREPAGGPGRAPQQAVQAFAPEDVNRDGSVDVLDAFAVARGVRAGRPAPAWDVTGDGVVDQRDVDAIAARAVSVAGRPAISPKGGVQ